MHRVRPGALNNPVDAARYFARKSGMALTCTDATEVDELPLTPEGLWSRLNAADDALRERMLTGLVEGALRSTACLLEGHPRSGA